MIWTLYSDKASSLPSGQYNFGGGSSLPFTPNTGIDFAAFEMGAVTSATFTRPQGIFLPRLWDHELYFQDDWKVRPNLSLNLGLRWTYSSPFKTKYDQQSQFDPDAIDPLTGLMGAITHPKGIIGKRDLNNFQPRVGLSWNFMPKWVFRGSFGVMTSDNSGAGGFEEYNGAFNIQSAHRRPAATCSCSRTAPARFNTRSIRMARFPIPAPVSPAAMPRGATRTCAIRTS